MLRLFCANKERYITIKYVKNNWLSYVWIPFSREDTTQLEPLIRQQVEIYAKTLQEQGLKYSIYVQSKIIFMDLRLDSLIWMQPKVAFNHYVEGTLNHELKKSKSKKLMIII